MEYRSPNHNTNNGRFRDFLKMSHFLVMYVLVGSSSVVFFEDKEVFFVIDRHLRMPSDHLVIIDPGLKLLLYTHGTYLVYWGTPLSYCQIKSSANKTVSQ